MILCLQQRFGVRDSGWEPMNDDSFEFLRIFFAISFSVKLGWE